VEKLKIVGLILGSALLFEACNPAKARIPTSNKRQAHAVSRPVSHPKAGRRRAQRNKSSPPQDPEYRRLLERARRWKEEQKKRRVRPVAPPTGSSEIALATSPERQPVGAAQS
jgi:hypothetical protein